MRRIIGIAIVLALLGASTIAQAGTCTRDQVGTVIRWIGSSYWKDRANLNALVWIANKESSLVPGARNKGSGAFGLFQIMPPGTCPSNRDLWNMMKRCGEPYGETKAGCTYIKRQYKNPINAKNFWLRHHWY